MPDKFIIKVSSLWCGADENLQEDKIIHIENGKIKSIGSFEDISLFPGEEILDWTGLTVLPGLIDCHTHLSMDASLDNYLDHMADGIPELKNRAVSMMKRDLVSGVTTCRCCGDKEFLDIAIRKEVNESNLEGPRLLVAAKGIRAAKGHGFVGYPFNGHEEIIKAIHENIEAGADFIKIYITGTLHKDGELPAFLNKEEIAIAIDEAHAAGLKVASHCVGGIGLDWAVESGLDSIEHAYHISSEQIRKVGESDTRIVLTPGAVLSNEVVDRLPERLIEGHYKERERMSQSMSDVISSGIPFAVGTDGIHGGLAGELIHLKNLGAGPLELLKAATINGAEVCGISSQTGSIEPGKNADIIAIEGNPMTHPEFLKNIKRVMKNGRMISPDLKG